MLDKDLLTNLLDRPDKSVRKAEGVVESSRGKEGNESGYDLTNPNLHHGTDANYAPTLPVLDRTGSFVPPTEGELSGQAISESFHLAVGDSGPTATAIADQNGHEGQAFSLNVSSHFTAPAAGDALTFSASLPTGLSIDAHTGVISGTPTDSDFGSNPVTVTATDAHGQAISESFHLAATNAEGQSNSDNSHSGDSGTTTTAGTDAHTGDNAGTSNGSDSGNNPTTTDAHGQWISEPLNLGGADHNDTFLVASHGGDNAITGSTNWTDAVDLHNIGQNTSFNLTEFAPDGHTVQSWTGLVVDGSAQSDHNITLVPGDHASITVNHVDGSATDHIVLQQIDHIKY
jgi:hypothetical protein